MGFFKMNDDMMAENENINLNMKGGEFGNETNIQQIIHISIEQRTTRKCLTVVNGIPEDIDLHKVLKAWKKIFNCNGSVRMNQKLGKESIGLSGDHREEICDFLIHEGIGTKEFIKIHG